MTPRAQNPRRIWFLPGIAAAVIAGWFLAPLLQVFLIIFAGVLLSVFLTQLTTRIANTAHVLYGPAYSVVITSLVLLFAAIGYYLGSQILAQLSEFSLQLSQAGREIEAQLSLQEWWRQIDRISRERQAAWAATQAVSTAKSAAWIALSFIAGGVLIAFLGFYIALQPQRYRDGFVSLFPVESQPRACRVLDRLEDRLWRWGLGRMVGMLVIGIGTFVGLWLIGVPLPDTLAVLAAALNFVPNFGPIIAGVPAVLFALKQGTNAALLVLALYFILQFFESYLLTPLIDQHQVSLPPGLTLSCQLLMGVLAGFLGLFLATPLVVVAVTLIEELKQRAPPQPSSGPTGRRVITAERPSRI